MSRSSTVTLLASVAALAAAVAIGLAIHHPSNRDGARLETLQYEYYDGGLFQFFWNTRGKDNAATLAALQRTGHDRHAELFERAILAYEAEKSVLQGAWTTFDDTRDVSVYSVAVERSTIPALDEEWATLPSLIPQD